MLRAEPPADRGDCERPAPTAVDTEYESGEPVREVDVVAHSMGGLIVRAYLAGKQPNGTFATPAAPLVRKVVFIGTPHFGTPVAS
jgi:triacylglycerol esterase/lipase EstA (alpha/beta hydrolase family)